MYLGSICEYADTAEFFENPRHPYTQMLLASIPVLSDEEERLKPQKIKSIGEIPSPLNKPKGCPFPPRCPFKKDICSQDTPQMREVSPATLPAVTASEKWRDRACCGRDAGTEKTDHAEEAREPKRRLPWRPGAGAPGGLVFAQPPGSMGPNFISAALGRQK